MMGENPIEPVVVPVSTPASEPVEAQPTSLIEEKPLMKAAEAEIEAETEEQDEEKLEIIENTFEELDEDLSDIEESTDTIWLLHRVGIGIFKILFLLAGLGFIGWLIWGGGEKVDLEKTKQEIAIVSQSVKDKLPQPKNIFSKPQKQESLLLDTTPIATQSGVGRSLVLWNYWIESQRLSNQTGILAEVLLWKREVETVFELPFPRQINGETPLVRDYQIGRLLQTLGNLLSRSDKLQQDLSNDIIEFSNKAALSRNLSIEAERVFLNSLKTSDPTGISHILDQKVEAEKDFQKFSVDAEARRIFAQKISEYQLVLENVQIVLTANREAIAQDIRVVNFPADPFGRVLSPGEWGASQ